MAPHTNNEKPASKSPKGDAAAKEDPQWTSGLKKLYDSVLDEPLPDSFADLLAKLDENEDK